MKTRLSKPARSKARYSEEVQTRGARIMASQWPQRGQRWRLSWLQECKQKEKN